MNYTNFYVDWRKNKMAARGQHIQEFVILAATLCCDNLNISWRDKFKIFISRTHSMLANILILSNCGIKLDTQPQFSIDLGN